MKGPAYSLSLDGFGSGMLGPSMRSWTFRSGLGCAAWLCIENFHEPMHAKEMASFLEEAVVKGRPSNLATGKQLIQVLITRRTMNLFSSAVQAILQVSQEQMLQPLLAALHLTRHAFSVS